ncbi:MAG: helix-turn-helix transcriptional regulator [Thermoplasmatota archaeon]
MGSPLPQLPELTWFELEILYDLLEEERYGNELLTILNSHLGEDSVSSGKLYPVLKKLEKAGLITRLKKKKGEKGSGRGGGNIPFLTRGVDRVYFEITDEGRREVDKAVNYATSILWNGISSRLIERIAARISEFIGKNGKNPKLGISVPDKWEEMDKAVKMLKDTDSAELFFLPMSAEGSREAHINPELFGRDIASFPSRYGDIPLKSDYLDSVISLVHMTEVPNRKRYIEEIVRIIKPDGRLMIVDFGRFDSYLLEEIFDRNVNIESDRKYKGEDIGEIEDLLDEYLDDIKASRIKEMFLITGKKR